MSQTATLYRISSDTFEQLVESGNNREFDITSVKDQATFQGSFMGLEFILSKGKDASTTQLIREVFNPRLILGGQDFTSLTPEEQFEFYESESVISYLDPTTISKLNTFLDKVTDDDIRTRFNSEELNENGIYPEVWHNDNSPDQAFNLRHMFKD